MNFDLRPQFPVDAAESQTREGGANAADNCVPTSHAVCMMALGFGDPSEPQDWTDYEYGIGYHGGESFQSAVDFITKHPNLFPAPPEIRVESPGDIVAAVRSYGGLGYPMVVAFWCDQGANIKPGPQSFQHASCPIAADDNGILVWNAWAGQQVYFTDADFRRCYSGGLTVFRRTVKRAAPAPQPPPDIPPPPAEEEDMYIRFTIEAGAEELVPGLRSTAARPVNVNLACDEKGGASCDLYLRKYRGDEAGHVGISVPIDNQAATDLNAMGAQDLDITLKVVNHGPNRVAVVVHQP